MNILILGGSGIISSEITNLALRQGHNVTIINRGKRKKSINQDAKLIVADLKYDKIDCIIEKLEDHYDSVIDVISYNINTLQRNMRIVGKRCDQYCLFSSAVVYKTKEGRYTELDEIGNSAWSYSTNKIECENTLQIMAKEYGLFWTVIRPYITYGKTRIPLQFGPLEYYTIINRARANKVIPVLNEEVKCTLTYSKDFAVGIVGLLGNAKAYNECFNIVGTYESTWNNVLKTTLEAFNLNYELVGISKKQFQYKQLTDGLNCDEVLGDKARDMLFDNRKIIETVPDFSGYTSYPDVVSEIVAYFSDSSNQIINYAWDARVDRMLSKLECLTPKQRKALKYAPGTNSSFRDRIIYVLNRYWITYMVYKVVKKFL